MLGIAIPGGLSEGAEEAATVHSSISNLADELREVERLRYAGDYQSGMEIAERVLAQARRERAEPVAAEAIYQIGLLHYLREEFDPARANLEIGYNLARQLSLRKLEADFLGARGVLEWKLGNLSDGRNFLEEALQVFADLGDLTSMASVANNLGLIAYSLQNYEEAIHQYQAGLGYLGDADNDRFRASLLSNLGEAMIHSGRLAEAEDCLRQSLAIEERLQEPRSLAYTYFNFGELRSRQGDSQSAIREYRRALELQLAIGDDWAAALTRLRCVEEYRKTGQTAQAMAELETGFRKARELNAVSLLRDYARLSSTMAADSGNDGLARYYADLGAWFATRVAGGEAVPEEPDFAGVAPANPAARATVPNRIRASVQTATILILSALIAFLAVENIRLRRGGGRK